MNMVDRVNEELADAMRARDTVKLSALRMLKTALVNRRVEKGSDLNEDDAQAVARKLAKQRRDSIEQFSRAGRGDLVDKETAELAILSTYLPPPVEDAEIEQIVQATIAEIGATSPKDMGRVMKAAMARLSGRGVDGKRVSDLVGRQLSS